jgi:predicted nucleic acid-binding protein
MILVDTGFIYALLDTRDAWHQRAAAALDDVDEGLITTWPVLTETVHLIMRSLGPSPAQALLSDVARGVIQVWQIDADATQKLPALMKRYADLPMDLADASLVLLAEVLGHGRILTTDERDFKTYRWKSRAPFQNLLGGR